MAQAAATTVKRVCQELGGKSAHIILHDSDLEAAARFNIARGLANSGQSCHAPTRVLVHESQAERVLQLMATEAQKLVVGDRALGVSVPQLDHAAATGPGLRHREL
ncbi:aldehyde dehydrogenase family protein [Cupriavidus basilensis]|uniref:aldehyde dehydrogenase family protein n=1 Tax=Cupriavidus basilensis TaxID=68895 RepID=UPI003D337B81